MEKFLIIFLMATGCLFPSTTSSSSNNNNDNNDHHHQKTISSEISEPGREGSLIRIIEEPQEDSHKRAVGMLRMGRSLPYPYLADESAVKRAVSLLRMGRSGINEKKAVSMLRMGKRAVSLLRMGRSYNGNSEDNGDMEEQYDEDARKYLINGSPNYLVDDGENYRLLRDNKRAVSMLRMG